MVRCSKCKKSFARSRGKCWDRGNMCGKCWNKGTDEKFIPPKVIIKSFITPMDMYLDRYTSDEIKNLDN